MFKKKVFISFTVILGVLSANYFSCSHGTDNAFGISKAESPIKDDDDVVKMSEMQDVFRKIYDLYENRVVSVYTEDTVRLRRDIFTEFFNMPTEQKRTGLGTGFVISEDGFICTNFHVISPERTKIVEKITVVVGTDQFPAEVKGYDEHKDIAILKINAGKKLESVFFADSDSVKVGDWVIAIGNPYGLTKTMTVGNVSAVNRKGVGEEGIPYIQTDASINQGNSGGPLINIKGEVIGINNMIFSQNGGSVGLGFAIPINILIENIDSLKKQKTYQKGYIGIALYPLTQELAVRNKWRYNYGVVVDSVLEGGPAHNAGLMRGDIIFGVNGKKVTSSNVLVQEIERAGAGSKIELDVWRNGSKMKFYLTAKAKE